jgi:hypothetical protein
MGANDLRWDGAPGHYEVWFVTLTDPGTGIGVWIRYTVHAPLGGAGGRAGSALWLLAMAPDGDRFARRATFPAEGLVATADPFRLRLGDADLSDRGAAGAVDDGAWELSWEPRLGPYEHVHPLARRTGLAQTVVALPHADLAISGTVRLGERTIELDGARGGQAHLWASRHAARWGGRTATTCARWTARRAATRSSTRSPRTSSAPGASSGRARRSSDASVARTLSPPARSPSRGRAAASS